ncbi:MAG TPA: alpha/beta fold hydrolase [Steroidobacteraceae bacterium]|nr:alpha/beta fold hydrolase [Steroidobacteraceae bacterium]
MIRLPRLQSVVIDGPAGKIEALLEEPQSSLPGSFGVLCHPHPLHGGTLHNKVVHTLARALHEFLVPTVRFNFRGVGASEGRFAEGIGETDDALAVIEWGRQRWPAADPWLLGFSFGGGVAIRAAARASAKLLVTVAPAIDRSATGTASSVDPPCPWLIVQGDADEVIDPVSVLEWASRESAARKAAALPVLSVHVMRGAGHFFHGRLPELREAVASFIREEGISIKESGAQSAG